MSESSWRYLGLALQVLGLASAAFGISRTRRDFTSRPSLPYRICRFLGRYLKFWLRWAVRGLELLIAVVVAILVLLAWLGSFPVVCWWAFDKWKAFPRKTFAVLAALALTVSQAMASHLPTTGRARKPTGIEVLTSQINDLQNQIVNMREGISSSKQELMAASQRIDERVTSLAASGLGIAAMGVALSLIGIILTTLSVELANIWASRP